MRSSVKLDHLGERRLPAALLLCVVEYVERAGVPHDAVDIVAGVGIEVFLDALHPVLDRRHQGWIAIHLDDLGQPPEALIAAA